MHIRSFPCIGERVVVRQWAVRRVALSGRLVWGGGEPVSVQATVTGVVRKYDGTYRTGSGSDYSIFDSEGNYWLPELIDRKAVEILAVRLTPRSKERLAWSWGVL